MNAVMTQLGIARYHGCPVQWGLSRHGFVPSAQWGNWSGETP